MIGALALIVIGPKDLPIAMRRVGQFIGKMRGMAAEFRASFDELARQSELEELRKEVDALRLSRESLTSAINPVADSELVSTVHEINQQMAPLSLGPVTTATLNAERSASATADAPVAEIPMPLAAPAESTPAPSTADRPKAARKSADRSPDSLRPKAGAKVLPAKVQGPAL